MGGSSGPSCSPPAQGPIYYHHPAFRANGFPPIPRCNLRQLGEWFLLRYFRCNFRHPGEWFLLRYFHCNFRHPGEWFLLRYFRCNFRHPGKWFLLRYFHCNFRRPGGCFLPPYLVVISGIPAYESTRHLPLFKFSAPGLKAFSSTTFDLALLRGARGLFELAAYPCPGASSL